MINFLKKAIVTVQYISIFFVMKTTALNTFYIPDTTTPGLARSNGYVCEVHNVTTDDGYIIVLHRLPGGKVESLNRSLRPVLLEHSLLATSADWLIPGPSEGLGYLLADLGYDVWMGNARGNTYSNSHISLSPDEPRFWNFTWNEMGIYDLPATIDYILDSTGHPQLHYVGISQGTLEFFVLMSTRPEYNSKILQMTALAPIAYLGNVSSLVLRLLVPFRNLVAGFLEFFSHGDFLPRNSIVSKGLKYFCSVKINQKLCADIIFLVAGFDPVVFNETLIPLIYKNDPAGTSVKSLLHYAQLIASGGFEQFDYGTRRNMQAYNSTAPPMYNISQITAPTTLMYAANDFLADPKDVLTLYEELQNQKQLLLINAPTFNHVDFNFAKSLKTLVNDRIVSTMKRYDASNISSTRN